MTPIIEELYDGRWQTLFARTGQDGRRRGWAEITASKPSDAQVAEMARTAEAAMSGAEGK